jgi:hypothetical protein
MQIALTVFMGRDIAGKRRGKQAVFTEEDPSSVGFAATFSHEGRRKNCGEIVPHRLLPSWEKVPEGRMRGN